MSGLDPIARAIAAQARTNAASVATRANSPALAALAQGQARPVDMVCLGDSLQLLGGYGWDAALTKAFAQDARFGVWASALLPQEAVGTSFSNQGWGVGAVAGATGATSGANASFDDKRTPQGNYFYTASGDIGAANGVLLQSGYEIDVNASLRFTAYYGTGPGFGTFRLGARMGQSPYTNLNIDGAVIDCAAGAYGEAETHIDLAAGARNYNVHFQLRRSGGTASVGPTLFLGQRVRNLDKTHGISLHSFYAWSGTSLWDVTAHFQDTISDARAMWGFGKLRAEQIAAGHKPIIVVHICFGVNDRNETSTPSRGDLAYAGDAASALAYGDNLTGLIATLEAAWTAQGWPLDELFFHIVTTYPTADPDDMAGYRSAGRMIAAAHNRCSFTDAAIMVPYAETVANSGLNDGIHFTQSWADEIARREVALIPSIEAVA